MGWDVEDTDEFEDWWDVLSDDEQDVVAAHVQLLELELLRNTRSDAVVAPCSRESTGSSAWCDDRVALLDSTDIHAIWRIAQQLYCTSKPMRTRLIGSMTMIRRSFRSMGRRIATGP